MIKVVIFDWGGVVAPNPNGGWLNLLADMLELPVEDVLPHWRRAGYADFSKGLISEEVFWRQFEISIGRPVPGDVSTIWIDGSALQPWPEMLTFIGQLRKDGIQTAVLSNTVEPMSSLAKKHNLYEGFLPVILSDEVGMVKPDADIYQHTLSRLSLSPHECVYVDDLEKNLSPAADIGMITVLASGEPSETIGDIMRVMKQA